MSSSKYTVSLTLPPYGLRIRAAFTKEELRRLALIGGVTPTAAYYQKVTGVRRPGKTAKDKANGHVPYRKNRREYDRDSGEWVKVWK